MPLCVVMGSPIIHAFVASAGSLHKGVVRTHRDVSSWGGWADGFVTMGKQNSRRWPVSSRTCPNVPIGWMVWTSVPSPCLDGVFTYRAGRGCLACAARVMSWIVCTMRSEVSYKAALASWPAAVSSFHARRLLVAASFNNTYTGRRRGSDTAKTNPKSVVFLGRESAQPWFEFRVGFELPQFRTGSFCCDMRE